MSLIVAIKDNDRIVIGCDSQITSNGLKENCDNNSVCKIWEIKNCKQGIMGVVGHLRDGQLVQCQNNIIEEIFQLKNSVDYEYVVTNLSGKIYSILLANKRILKDANGNDENYMLSRFIIAYKDKAYKIENDLCVLPIEDYLVLGCGEKIAIGVLEKNKSKSPEERIKEAIILCSEKDLYINNNIVIKSTKEDK
ncbi:MAG: hypothetical protein RR342_01405 [Bacilli bacterium]